VFYKHWRLDGCVVVWQEGDGIVCSMLYEYLPK